MLVRFTQLDYNRELVLVAVLEHAEKETKLGVARYVMNPDRQSCELALVVTDAWHSKGIGSHLMTELMEAARQRGFRSMEGEILTSTHHMPELAENFGCRLRAGPEARGIKVASGQL